MNRLIPIGLFCLGLGALGWWAQKDHAHRMEQHVQEGAVEAMQTPWRHDVAFEVSGRDISISGIAHDDLEKAKMLSALEKVPGHRVIHDEIDLLPFADNYALMAIKDETGLVLTGVVGDAVQKLTIHNAYPSANVDGITLASGEPNGDWAPAALASLNALDQLDTGIMRMDETVVFISGEAPNIRAKTGVESQLITLPSEYRFDTQVTAPKAIVRMIPADPDSPAVIPNELAIDTPSDTNLPETGPTDGAVVEGRLPTVVSVEGASTTFKSANLDTGAVEESVEAEPVLDDAAVALPQTLEDAQEVATLSQPAEATPAAPVEIGPSLTSCQSQTDAILSEAQVSFVPSSAELKPDARAVVQRLADVMAACVTDARLIAVVSGHTDSQGSEDDNLQLSDDRARSVVAQLTANGLPEFGLMSRGFGESQPIADNATAEGRAANRRTEIRWIKN